MIARPAYTDAQRGPPSDHGGIRKRPWRQPALAEVSIRAGQGQEALSTRYSHQYNFSSDCFIPVLSMCLKDGWTHLTVSLFL